MRVKMVVVAMHGAIQVFAVGPVDVVMVVVVDVDVDVDGVALLRAMQMLRNNLRGNKLMERSLLCRKRNEFMRISVKPSTRL